MNVYGPIYVLSSLWPVDHGQNKWPLKLTLTYQKLITTFEQLVNICAKFHENWTRTFSEITT